MTDPMSGGHVKQPTETLDPALDRVRAQRISLESRHSQALTRLMEERGDLRGVHALADFFDDSAKWSA